MAGYSQENYNEVKKVVNFYTQHIARSRIAVPPAYTDNVVCNRTCPDWRIQNVSDVGPNFRNFGAEDYFRIGDCIFTIPPEQISVKAISQTNQIVGLRQKDAVKSKTGHRHMEIRIPVVFNGLDQINGYKVPGPEGLQFVDGLRPLIAQAKKTPFLPVENYHLNVNLDIHTVVIGGLSINTVEGFPDLLQGELVLYEFNAQPYITLPTEAMTDIIDWDLFRWYYQRSLHKIDETMTYLEEMKDGTLDWFRFLMIEEEVLAALTEVAEDVPTIQDYYMKKIELPEDIHIKSIYIGMGNVVKNIFLSDQSAPTTQYLGATSSLISCTLETQNESAIVILRKAFELCEEYSRTYRNRNMQGYLEFDCPLTRLFGIKYVVIDSFVVDTVPEFPDLYKVNLLMSSFEKTQARLESPTGISPVGGVPTIEDLLNNKARDRNRVSIYDQAAEELINKIDLYPDLELPTRDEVSHAIGKINNFRIRNRLGALPYTAFYGHNSVRVEPDFYFCYPTMEQMGLLELIEGSSDIVETTDSAGRTIRKRFDGEGNLVSKTYSGKFSTPTSDVVVGPMQGGNLATIDDVISKASPNTSSNNMSFPSRTDYDTHWSQVKNIFKVGDVAVVYDIKTGKSFNIKRTSGVAHANCETLTTNDTNMMRQIAGGKWTWARRPIVILHGAKAYAASMHSMPHAGFDDVPEGQYIEWREDTLRPDKKYQYGNIAGEKFNLLCMDNVKGNGMDGHFCVHFKGSEVHATEASDDRHQNVIQEAKRWIIQNNAESKLIAGKDLGTAGTKISSTETPTSYVSGIITEEEAIPKINLEILGAPIRTEEGYEVPNSTEGLTERMCVDMVQYNRRGTMARAFPTFLMLFVDEGMWMDGRRAWSNYYVWHSLCNISVEKDKSSPAQTAIIQLINIYNSLGTNPKVEVGEFSFYKEFLKGLQIYTGPIMNNIVKNRARLLSSFNVKPGARIHLRMGYGAGASDLPVVFNGTITEVDTQDIVTLVAQSDGYELTTRPIGAKKEDSTNTVFNLGREPENIISSILAARSNGFWYHMSGGKWSEVSKYGIEHFGNLFFKGSVDIVIDSVKKFGGDKAVEKIMDGEEVNFGKFLVIAGQFTAATLDATVASTVSAFFPWGPESKWNYEDYDLVKNIYKATGDARSRKEGKGRYNQWKEWFDGELDLKFYLYNKTAWDIFQVLAAAAPGYICQPHDHQFRSTLFYGLPWWNVRYKYEYDFRTKKMYQYSKPYSQIHIINSLYDIIDNKIKVVPPEFTAVVSTYDYGKSAKTERTGTLYADATIKGELQKHKLLDTTLYWNPFGPQFTDDAQNLLGIDPGKEVATSVGVTSLEYAFKEMYQGSLIVLGDATIKPFDIISLDDSYVGMAGNINVGRVVHHMGIDTGFVTEIKPDLQVVPVDAGTELLPAIQAASCIASAIAIHARSAKICSKIVKSARTLLGIQKAASAATKTAEVTKTMTGVKNVTTAVKAGKAGLTAGKIGAALGSAAVTFGLSLIIWQLIDSVFSSIIEWFENQNVLKIYPLWYQDKPFVAGVNGQQKLIPGWADSDFYQNYYADPDRQEAADYVDQVGQSLPGGQNSQWIKESQESSTFLSGSKEDKERLKKFNEYLEEKNLYDIFEHQNKRGTENTGVYGKGSYRPINLRFRQREINGSYIAEFSHKMLNWTLDSVPVFAFASGKVITVQIERTRLNDAGLSPSEKVGKFENNINKIVIDVNEKVDSKDKADFDTVIVIEHSSLDSNGKPYSWNTLYGALVTSFVVPGDVVTGGQAIGVAKPQVMNSWFPNATSWKTYPQFQIFRDSKSLQPKDWMEEDI